PCVRFPRSSHRAGSKGTGSAEAQSEFPAVTDRLGLDIRVILNAIWNKANLPFLDGQQLNWVLDNTRRFGVMAGALKTSSSKDPQAKKHA
ncbi:MAG: hypothetical protein ABIL58_11705, partial [Pseudomonadota bacterium]